MFILKKTYNPGFITGLLLLIPFGIYVFSKLMEHITIRDVLIGILIFIVGTALIPLSILIGHKINIPNRF
jgi:predicted ABC-type exoprotein transport system permease subunit